MASGSTASNRIAIEESTFRNPFIDPWEILRRRWKTVVLGFLLGVWVGVVYYIAAPPVYESLAQILVIQKDPNLPAHGTDKGASFESNQFSTVLTTHLQLVVSPRVIRQAIRASRLDLLPTFERARSTQDPEGLNYVIDHLEAAAGDPDAPETASSRVMQVKFKHSSPEECGIVLQAIVSSYQRFVNEKFHDIGSEAVDLLTQAKSELNSDLQSEEAAYLKFLEEAPLLWRGDGGKNPNLYQQRIQALETALSDVRLRHTEARARLEVIEGALQHVGRPEISEIGQLALLNEKEVARLGLLLAATKGDADNESFQAMQPHRVEAYRARYDQLLALEAKEQSLLIELGEKHPRVLETRESIRATRDFLDRNSPKNDDLARRQLRPHEMVGTYADLLKHDVDDLERREQELLTHSARESTAAKSLLIFELRGEALRQEVNRKRQLYEAVVDRLKEVGLMKDFGGITTEVVSPVEIGKEPKLYLPIVLAIGAVLGVFAGGGIAWVSDARDQTLRDPTDVRRHTGQLPVLAHVLDFDEIANYVPGAANSKSALVVQDSPRSPASESIRTLQTALAGAGREAPLKTVEVVSAVTGDGKSTLVANLAAAIARAGNRVLAVDADFRNPGLHEILGVENRIGLSDVIAGTSTSTDVIQHSRVEHLDVVSAGSLALQTGSGNVSATFKSLLDEWRSRYDMIVVDTPAVLLAADACELAPQADGVVLVINPAATTRTQAHRTSQALRAAGAKLLGIVVNAVYRQGPYECDELIEAAGRPCL